MHSRAVRGGAGVSGAAGRSQMVPPKEENAPAGLVLLAFATIYVVWGSTYLAIRYALESLPPFVMAGTRFLAAGGLLYTLVRARRTPPPARRQWMTAAITGTLMLVGGNGLVSWAEQTVPSGLAALLIATMPLWMVMLDWAAFRGERPSLPILAGLAVGLAGVGLLIGPAELRDQRVHPLGAAALLAACLSWAIGSLYSRKANLPRSALLSVAMQMLSAGVVLVLVGTATGEWARVDLSAVSVKSVAALVYLVLFGSIAALSAYVWLLRVCSAARVVTYAYVNPVVAVLLGNALAGEPLTPRIGLAATLILGAVLLVTARRRPAATKTPAPAASRLAEAPVVAHTGCCVAEEPR